MESFGKNKEKVISRIQKSKRMILMLDFDGTISPLVSRPEDAFLPEKIKKIILKIMKKIPVAIVTGRPLDIIKKKVGIKGLIYTASHGYELQFGKKIIRETLRPEVTRVFAVLRAKIKKLIRVYPALILEEKKYSCIFHYHRLSKKDLGAFLVDLQGVLLWLNTEKSVRILRDEQTIEIVPRGVFTKAYAVKKIFEYLYEKGKVQKLPIYIGDSLSDEDAFRILKDGITIRVGYSKDSKAKYFFKKRSEIDVFLNSISVACNGHS